MEKKYIIYVGGFILPDGNAAAHRVLANAKILRNLGYEVVFLGNQKLNVLKTHDLILNEKIVDGFKSYTIIYPTSFKSWINHLYSIKELKKIIKHIGSTNVYGIIAYNYQALALKSLVQLCKKSKIKLIADCTEWQVVKRKSILISWIKNMDTFYRMKILHKKLDGMIAISSYLYNYYKSRMKNVLLLPPLVDLNDDKWKNKKQNIDKKCKLIYAGSPGTGSKDRVDKVLKALSKIKYQNPISFMLTIVGITKEQYINNFGNDSLPTNLEEELIFKGRISHADTIKATQNSDFTIFLRDNNLITMAGFPTKFVESISCGIPVLTNSSSNIIDYLEKGSFGFLLDISSENLLVDSLYKAISQSQEEVNEMKKQCELSNLFDYHSYQNDMHNFMNQLSYS